MATLMCIRCKNNNPALDKPPFTGALGKTIHEQVCKSCWSDWMAMQIKVINEYKLSLGDPRAHQIIEEQMRLFLNLGL